MIYRPAHGNFHLFLQEVETPILENETSEDDVIYLGEFNIWVDDIRNSDGQNFPRLQNNFSHVNLVSKLTFNSGHILDLFITKKHHSPVEILGVDTINTLSDLRNVNFHFNFSYANVERKLISFRKKKLYFSRESDERT